jgi:hypothetical protein
MQEFKNDAEKEIFTGAKQGLTFLASHDAPDAVATFFAAAC